jgi:catechol 2,3-dioxygenase-like lactoylglutathione lyase family enzyme
MMSQIAQIALVVRDYDEAIAFYCGVLGFQLLEDTVLSETKRWVVVKPEGEGGCALLLAKAVGEEQERAIGNQSGGRVFLFLHTNNFEDYLERITQHKLVIVRGPVEEAYGKVLVFEDIYGNKWDLIGKK